MKRMVICFFLLVVCLASCRHSQARRLSIDTTAQASSEILTEPKNTPDNESFRQSSSYNSERVSGVQITSPSNDAEVDSRPMVGGVVEDPEADVSVIVHPMDIEEYWVQQSVTVRRTGRHGSFLVKIYIGDSETLPGTRFEIRAVANPRRPLKQGMVLTAWPSARWTSDVVYVIRK